MRHGLFALVLAFVALLLPAATRAQGVTTSSISGEVTAAGGGEPLPGATISAVHEPTGTRYGAVTHADGRYRIPDVRVGGPYTVDCTMTGFKAQTKKDLFTKLGEDLPVDFELEPDRIEEDGTRERLVPVHHDGGA